MNSLSWASFVFYYFLQFDICTQEFGLILMFWECSVIEDISFHVAPSSGGCRSCSHGEYVSTRCHLVVTVQTAVNETTSKLLSYLVICELFIGAPATGICPSLHWMLYSLAVLAFNYSPGMSTA